MKMLFYFFVLFLYVIGAIGGIGYAVYCDAYVIALGIVVNATLALPKAKELYDEMTGNNMMY